MTVVATNKSAPKNKVLDIKKEDYEWLNFYSKDDGDRVYQAPLFVTPGKNLSAGFCVFYNVVSVLALILSLLAGPAGMLVYTSLIGAFAKNRGNAWVNRTSNHSQSDSLDKSSSSDPIQKAHTKSPSLNVLSPHDAIQDPHL